MRVISNKALLDFAQLHPAAAGPFQAWRRPVEANAFQDFADIRRAFNAADRVKASYALDIGGNKYRIVAVIHFNAQKIFVRHVFTHKEDDAWKP